MNKEFWEQKYFENQTHWDAGSITTPLKTYVDQLPNKDIKILIPGAGNAHEAAYLWTNGFKNIYILDFAHAPLENFKNSFPEFPSERLLLQDFFTLSETFDLIIEQTFFCALSPDRRSDYVSKMHALLKPKGKLMGVLFDFPLTEVGPPFGGDLQTYNSLFSSIFVINKLERCYNSIKPRANKEFFLLLEKL